MPTTNWTNVTNSFADGTAYSYENATYVQGGAFSASEIKQEVALVEAYKSGTAVLNFARSNVTEGDIGAVVLEALPVEFSSAVEVSAALGNRGTFTKGWRLNDASGNAVAAFGGSDMVVSGTPLYAQTGPLGADDNKAIKLEVGSQFGTLDILDPDLGDLVVTWSAFATTGANGDIIGKGWAAAGGSWLICRESDGLSFYFRDTAGNETAKAVLLHVNDWHAGIAVIDRATLLLSVGTVNLRTGAQSLNSGSITALTSGNTGAFRFGSAGGYATDANIKLAGVYAGVGVGAAAGIHANMSACLTSLAAAHAIQRTAISPPEEKNEGTNTYTLIKTVPGMTWGVSGAFSNEYIEGDGYVEWIVPPAGAAFGGWNAAVGLSSDDSSASYDTIDYALDAAYLSLYQVESGGLTGLGVCNPGDVLRVERIGTVIYYKQNGTVVATSAVASTGRLYVDVALYGGSDQAGFRSGVQDPKLYDRGNRRTLTWTNAIGIAGYNAYTNPRGTWAQKRITMEIPARTASLRTRLLAERTAAYGNSGAAFDDFDLQVHKHMDAVAVADLDFSEVPVQSVIVTWQDFHLAYPDLGITPACVVAQLEDGELQLSSPLDYANAIAWSDGNPRAAGRAVGAYGDGIVATPCITFARAAAGAAIDVQVTSGTTERGAFTAAESFSVRVEYRVLEDSFGVACGLVGRRDNTGVGWGMQINASGQLSAILQGAGGTKTATQTGTARPVIDGALHCAWMIYDATAQTVRIYNDRRGYVETSTAAALGEFAVATAALRIGRDGPASQSFPGQIVSVALFDGVAFTQAQAESTWTYGKDPTALLTTNTRAFYIGAGWPPAPCAVYVDAGLDENNEATLVRHAYDQIPIGYHASSGQRGLTVSMNIAANLATSWEMWRDRGETIKKTGAASAFDAGCSSVQMLAGDGYLEVIAPAGGFDGRCIGLSETDPDVNFTTIGWLLAFDNTTIGGWRLGAQVMSSIPFYPGDVFRLRRSGSTFTIERDGVVLHTFAATSSAPVMVDSALYVPTANLHGVRLVDGTADIPISWKNVVNVATVKNGWQIDGIDFTARGANNRAWGSLARMGLTVDGAGIFADGYAEFTAKEANTDRIMGIATAAPASAPYDAVTGYAWRLDDDGTATVREAAAPNTVLAKTHYNHGTWTIQKTGGTPGSFDAGCISVQTLAGNCEVRFVASGPATEFYRAVGFATTDPDQNIGSMTHAIGLWNAGVVFALESGSGVGSTTWLPGDTFAIKRVGTAVTYLKNGAVFYTSGVASSGAVFIDTAISVSLGSITGLTLFDNDVLVPLLWQNNVNVTASQTAQTQDTLRIERVGTSIRYRKNGELIYTSGVSSSGALCVYGATYTGDIADRVPSRERLTTRTVFSPNRDVVAVARDWYFGTPAAVSDIRVVSAGTPISSSVINTNTLVTDGMVSGFNEVDASGLPRGASFYLTASKGVRFTGMPATSIAKIQVAIWAKADVAGSAIVRCLNAAGGLIDQATIALTTLWKRHDVTIDGWDNSTSTFSIEMFAAATSTPFMRAHVSHVACVHQEMVDVYFSQAATMVPGRAGGGGDHASAYYAFSIAATEQFCAEGEIDIQGVSITQSGPGQRASFISVWNQAEQRNRRDLSAINIAGDVEYLHYLADDTLGSINYGLPIDWRVPWRMRARWNSAGLVAPETGYAGIRVDGNVDSSNYNQVVAWTRNSYKLPNQVIIGASAAANTRMNGYTKRITLRTSLRRL